MIRSVTHSAHLAEAIDRARRGAQGVTTNWFATPAQAECWIQRGTLYYAEAPRALLLFRRDRNFYHVHHVAAGQEALCGALAEFTGQPDLFTADLVGYPEEVSALATLYEAHGFSSHCSLMRMARFAQSSPADDFQEPEVAFAEPSDIPGVCAFLDRLLDPFRDNIPEPDELASVAARHNILIVKRGAEPGGLLSFETTGFTSILRYWYVADDCRDQGIGARLIRTFFQLCAASKRIILWVDPDNLSAITKYEHYGFRRENLVDRIMIKGIPKA